MLLLADRRVMVKQIVEVAEIGDLDAGRPQGCPWRRRASLEPELGARLPWWIVGRAI
jgi:hypothetical protein